MTHVREIVLTRAANGWIATLTDTDHQQTQVIAPTLDGTLSLIRERVPEPPSPIAASEPATRSALRALRAAIIDWITARLDAAEAAGEARDQIDKAIVEPIYLAHLALDGARATSRVHDETTDLMAERMADNLDAAFARLGLDARGDR